MQTTIRELSEDEMHAASGGILPVLAAIGSFAGHAGVRSVGGYLFTRSMSAYGVYSAAASFKSN